MAGATEGLDLNQALDVQSNVAAQVAFNDDVSLIDVVTDLSLFFQSQVLDAGIGVDASCFQDLVSTFEKPNSDLLNSSVVPGEGTLEDSAELRKPQETKAAAADDDVYKGTSRIDIPTFLQR